MCAAAWTVPAMGPALWFLAGGGVVGVIARFCAGDAAVTFSVLLFTDQPAAGWYPPFVRTVAIERHGWPQDSLLRPETYTRHADALSQFDFAFSMDADFWYADDVCWELLGRRVGVLVPWFYSVRALARPPAPRPSSGCDTAARTAAGV